MTINQLLQISNIYIEQNTDKNIRKPKNSVQTNGNVVIDNHPEKKNITLNDRAKRLRDKLGRPLTPEEIENLF